MTSLEGLRKELAEQRKKIKDAREERKLKVQLNILKSPVKRAFVSGAKTTGKAFILGAKKLREEGIRRQKMQLKKKPSKKKTRDTRRSISSGIFQPLDF